MYLNSISFSYSPFLQAAINILLNLIKFNDSPAATEGQKKKKKRSGGLLLRPIICICNDLYAPALRQLRQNALVVNFPITDSTKLAGRLLEVSLTSRYSFLFSKNANYPP